LSLKMHRILRALQATQVPRYVDFFFSFLRAVETSDTYVYTRELQYGNGGI
jgi:hypothetical protein